MVKNKFIKILTSLLICVSFFVLHITPVFAETFYDFSDEAQEKFNTENNIIVPTPTDPVYTTTQDTTKKNKKKNKNVIQPEVIEKETIIAVINDKVLEGNVVYIPEGTSFQAVLQSSISSASLSTDDTIAAVIHDDWIYNGTLIAPMGSIVYGKTVDAKKAGAAYGNGRLAITFTEIMTPKGESIKLNANIVEVHVESQRAMKVAAKTIAGAAIGMAMSVLFAIVLDRDIARAALVGGGVGAAGGTFNAVLQKGEEAKIPAGTGIDVRLVQPINVTPYE